MATTGSLLVQSSWVVCPFPILGFGIRSRRQDTRLGSESWARIHCVTAIVRGWTLLELRSPFSKSLMRHSDIRTTMNIYGDVVTDEMEQAHSKVAALALKRRAITN